MTERLEGYRKLVAMLVSAAIVFALRQLGLGVEDLAIYGVHLPELRAAVVDWLIQVGIPAVVFAAQPEQFGDRITRHWRWIVWGLSIVAGATVFVIVVP